jgi:sarcosine oxidase gamma subunit
MAPTHRALVAQMRHGGISEDGVAAADAVMRRLNWSEDELQAAVAASEGRVTWLGPDELRVRPRRGH